MRDVAAAQQLGRQSSGFQAVIDALAVERVHARRGVTDQHPVRAGHPRYRAAHRQQSGRERPRHRADLDTEVRAFRERPLSEQPFPYVFLDATYSKARVNHRVVSQAVVIATGVAADVRREALGFDVGDSEDGAFWTAFLRSLQTRGLAGVHLVISDAHAGLRGAIEAVLIGAAWQRCRVHFLRNVLAQVPKGSAEMVAAAIRTIVAQPDAEHVREQLDTIAGMLGRQLPKVESMLREAADDITAFADFPVPHWKKIWSTNPLERLNKEIKRRTDVVGVFPNPAALLRLAGSVLVEAHDEWQVANKRYLSETTLALLKPCAQPAETVAAAPLSRHSEDPQSLKRNADRLTPLHGGRPSVRTALWHHLSAKARPSESMVARRSRPDLLAGCDTTVTTSQGLQNAGWSWASVCRGI